MSYQTLSMPPPHIWLTYWPNGNRFHPKAWTLDIGKGLSDEQLFAVQKWINEGAPRNEGQS